MINFIRKKRLIITYLFALYSGLLSCSKEEVAGASKELDASARKTKITTTPNTDSTAASTYNFSVNWTNRINGPYGFTQAAADFRNTVYWNAFSTQIVNGTLRATLGKDLLGPAGGAMSKMNVPDAAAYQLQFDMMFDSQFDFSAGGKIGFGFLIGAGYTGGIPGWDGNGGSARLMWFKGSDGNTYLKPYTYYKDQPGTYGNDFGKKYPSTGSIQRGIWHTVKMYVKANTGSNTDGRIQIVINGVTLIDQPIRWTTNDLQRVINNVCFENFRGGAEAYWQSATDGHIYFNNVKWQAY